MNVLTDPSPRHPPPQTAGISRPGAEPSRALPRFLTRQLLLDGDYRVVGYELGINDRMPIPVPPGATRLE